METMLPRSYLPMIALQQYYRKTSVLSGFLFGVLRVAAIVQLYAMKKCRQF